MDWFSTRFKLQFKHEEACFFGHRWNSTGISPDPKKIESILRRDFPPDKSVCRIALYSYQSKKVQSSHGILL